MCGQVKVKEEMEGAGIEKVRGGEVSQHDKFARSGPAVGLEPRVFRF